MVSIKEIRARQKDGHQLIEHGIIKDRGCGHCPRTGWKCGLLLVSCSCGALDHACMDCANDHFMIRPSHSVEVVIIKE